jgi:hypothetical protein
MQLNLFLFFACFAISTCGLGYFAEFLAVFNPLLEEETNNSKQAPSIYTATNPKQAASMHTGTTTKSSAVPFNNLQTWAWGQSKEFNKLYGMVTSFLVVHVTKTLSRGQ